MTNASPKRGRRGRVLVVDDDRNLRLILCDRLRARGHDSSAVGNLADALDALARESFHLLCLDAYLPDQRDLAGLDAIRSRHANLPVVVMTAHGSIDLAVEAMRKGAQDFITKPLDFARLELIVERVLSSGELLSEVDYLRRAADQPFSEIVGANGGLAAVMEQVRRVAAIDGTVLLRGETGTGKEVIARAIHRHSPRRSRPFVVANSAAIPRDLMESQMFGHKRGSFTGAVDDHSGSFETAGDGTLLLDEIGDLSPDLQAKILRVLEDGSFQKVGASTMLRSRARIIAATHQPLEKLMEEGRFREDLFYRLNVHPIDLPPLRERREDLPALADYFLRQASRGARAPMLAGDAVALLEQHPWRGNLRELRNCMERLILSPVGERITAAELEPLLHHRRAARTELPALPLRELEERAIRSALARCGGNRTKAAEALGIGRRTLQMRLKEYGLAEE